MDEDMQKDNVAAFAGSKPHYELLDGLRGVAALMVMWFLPFVVLGLEKSRISFPSTLSSAGTCSSPAMHTGSLRL